MANHIEPKRPAKLYLEEWMAIRGIDVDGLAKKMGLPYVTVWRWVNGERRPRWPDTAKAIAEALEVEVSELSHHPSLAAQKPLLAGLSDDKKKAVLDYIEYQRSKED